MKTFAVSAAALSLAACGLLAQSPSMSCRDQGRNRGAHFCEIRESTLSALSGITVDGRQNGGVSIKGASRSDVLVRAMVQANGDTDSEASSIGAQVIVHTSGGGISADGPQNKGWSVSYEVFVPTGTNLTLKTNNGGVSVQGVESSIEFHAVNGGISLKNVGGYVHGDTHNGGVSVSLTNGRWSGQGLDVETRNGGVSLKVPEQFSALLDVSTVNGGMSVRLPNAQTVRNQHRVNMTLGTGGPLLRIRTTNGGVSVSSTSGTA